DQYASMMPGPEPAALVQRQTVKKKLTIVARCESDSGLFSWQKLTALKSCGRFELCLWMDSPCRCTDSANHITSSRQALILTSVGPSGNCSQRRRVRQAHVRTRRA